MIGYFALFGDILFYPFTQLADDPFMGILFYMMLIFFVLNLLCYVIGR